MRWRVVLLALAIALTGCATHPVDTPADVSLHLQQRLDTAFNPGPGGIDRPASTPVRFALPNGWANLMRRCMNDVGYSLVNYDREDGFTNVDKTGDGALAWYHCTQQLPDYDTVYVEFTGEQLHELYDYYVDVLVPCAGALGVPVTQVPSRAAFADGGEGQTGGGIPSCRSSCRHPERMSTCCSRAAIPTRSRCVPRAFSGLPATLNEAIPEQAGKKLVHGGEFLSHSVFSRHRDFLLLARHAPL